MEFLLFCLLLGVLFLVILCFGQIKNKRDRDKRDRQKGQVFSRKDLSLLSLHSSLDYKYKVSRKPTAKLGKPGSYPLRAEAEELALL